MKMPFGDGRSLCGRVLSLCFRTVFFAALTVNSCCCLLLFFATRCAATLVVLDIYRGLDSTSPLLQHYLNSQREAATPQTPQRRHAPLGKLSSNDHRQRRTPQPRFEPEYSTANMQRHAQNHHTHLKYFSVACCPTH